MYSSIVSCECSVSFTVESSRNVIAIRPLEVTASSLDCTENFKSAVNGDSSLLICALPETSDTPPISATEA